MRKRYKHPQLQGMYEVCYTRGADDFYRRRGGTVQNAFMTGYEGLPIPKRYAGLTFARAAFMAGKDRHHDERLGKIQPAKVKDQRLLNMT